MQNLGLEILKKHISLQKKNKIMRSPKNYGCSAIINTWGNGLISKRPERYSEDKWPTFYKSKGLNV